MEKCFAFLIIDEKKYKEFKKHFRFHPNPKAPKLLLPVPMFNHRMICLVSQINIINRLIWADRL